MKSLPQLMEQSNVPGLAVAMIRDGAVEWARGFGVKKAGTTDAVTPDTVFGAASLGKAVFAYAVLRMRDERLIDLDRPLKEYLAAFDLPDDPRSAQVTARRVLSHTTGWQNWRNGKDERLIFDFAPGERFNYSGEGYFYLQRVVEQITGRGFEGYMRERVLLPLGMTHSSYTWLPEYDATLSSGHDERGRPSPAWSARLAPKLVKLAAQWNKPLADWRYEDMVRAMPEINAQIPVLPNYMVPNCAGTLLTTVREYAQFMTRVTNGARHDSVSLAEATRREMLTPQVRLNTALDWGLGWGLERAEGREYFWHWGDNGTFKNFAMGDPLRRTGVVVFTNGSNGHKVWERIVAQATGRDHASFLWWMV